MLLVSPYHVSALSP